MANIPVNMLGVTVRFVLAKWRSGVVESGARGGAMGSMISAGTERVGGWRDERESITIRTLWLSKLFDWFCQSGRTSVYLVFSSVKIRTRGSLVKECHKME